MPTLRAPDGSIVTLPDDQVQHAVVNGYQPVSLGEAAQTTAAPTAPDQSGLVGGVNALTTGALSGATLGLSDVALAGLLSPAERENLQASRSQHPVAEGVGQLGGALVGSLAAPGSILARSPAGIAGNLSTRLAVEGGESLLGRAAATATGAAAEGALQNAGAYVSDVALGDRDLSAEGFIGAMGEGALWGGATGAGLVLGGAALEKARGLIPGHAERSLAARKLFPKQDVTGEAASATRRDASRGIAEAMDDSKTLEDDVGRAIDNAREVRIATDPEFAAKAHTARTTIPPEADLDTLLAGLKSPEVGEVGGRLTPHDTTLDDLLKGLETPEVGEVAGIIPRREAAAETTFEGTKVGKRPREVAPEVTSESTAVGKRPAAVNQPEIPEPKVGGPADLQAFLAGATAQPAAAKVGGSLEDQLRGTLEAVQGGESISAVGARGRAGGAADQALNRELARVDPKVRELSEAATELKEARAKTEAWLAKYEEREAGKLSAELPDDIKAMSPEERISKALAARSENVSNDVVEAARVLGRYEAAQADLIEAAQKQGVRVPPAAIARAEAFREAQKAAAAGAQRSVERAADGLTAAGGHIDMGGATPLERAAQLTDKAGSNVPEFKELGKSAPSESAAPTPSKGMGVIGSAGAVYEGLRMLGVPLPNPHDIPVIGPVLSLWLKAKVLGKAFGRYGGRVGHSPEATIASHAAATKERMFSAVDQMLGLAAKGATRAASSAGATAVLAHKLFDMGHPERLIEPIKGSGKDGEMYAARAAELAAASQPGAVQRAVRMRVHTADPELTDAVAKALERQVSFLLGKMPKPQQADGILPGSTKYTPNRAEMSSWARSVRAATDPASVLEDLAAGRMVTPEAAEALRVVYPKLFLAAQVRLVEKAGEADPDKPIPFGVRQQASLVFDVPLDVTQTPEFAAWAQQGFVPPQQPPPPGAPIKLVAPMNLGKMTGDSR